MLRKRRYSTEQIIIKLREEDVMLGEGMEVEEIARQLEVSKQTTKLKFPTVPPR